jgi:hypothetical protein
LTARCSAWRKILGGFPVIRRALVLDRFPYALYFTVDDDLVTVPVSFPASQDPRRWQEHT